MKIAKTLLLFFVATLSAHATSTLTFGSSSIFATNWADDTGAGGSLLAWGILIDTTGNGISPNLYEGFNYSTGLQVLSTSSGVTDDVLFIGTAGSLMTLTTNANDGGAIGLNRIGAIAGVPYTNGVSLGDTFSIIWFNKTTLGGTASAGEKYGVYQNAALVLPADGTASQPYTSVFTGADTLKTQGFTVAGVPEPSVALLGAVGVIGLLRRRRN